MIKALFAVDHYGGMGFNGSLPWPHNAEDMAHFQRHTLGHVVVMGSRTWLDPKLPKPLEGRIVYVASSKRTHYATQIQGDLVEQVLQIEKAHPSKTIWVVGGPKIIEECLDLYDAIHLTHFKGSYKIDTKIDLKRLLTGFTPVRADVAKDFKSTMVKYEPIFKRNTTNT